MHHAGSSASQWQYCQCCCYPTPSEGMRHGGRPGSPKSRATPRAWTRGCRETESCQRVRSWTVQNKMRGVLERVSAGAAEKALYSANSRENTAIVTRKHRTGQGHKGRTSTRTEWKSREPVCRRI